MIEVQEMVKREIEEVLARVGYGHLACVRDDRPYIVPIHYAYDKPDIYIYTTDGMKSEIIRENPHVCLQVEEVVDNNDWRSIIVNCLSGANEVRSTMSIVSSSWILS